MRGLDVILGLVVLGMVGWCALTFTARYRGRVDPTFARVEKQGAPGPLRRIYQMGYFNVKPVARVLARLGVTGDTVSWTGAAVGMAAGVATGVGELGLASLLVFGTGFLDVADGMVARITHTAGPRGAVLDSFLDRTVDFSFHAGAAWLWRDEPVLLAVALLAVLGSFNLSYSSALAEREGVTPPRGLMRRLERGILVLTGTVLSTFTVAWEAEQGLPPALPLAVLTGLVALGANVSAARRLAAVRHALS